MTAKNQNITIMQGNRVDLEIPVVDRDGEPVEAPEAEAVYKLAKTVSADPLVHKTNRNGITISQEDDALLLWIVLQPEDTAELDAGVYYHETQLTVTDYPFTVMRGMVTVEETLIS